MNNNKDSQDKRLTWDNEWFIIFSIFPILLSFIVFYHIAKIESLYWSIFISCTVSFILSVSMYKTTKKLSLCKNINYACSFTGSVIYSILFFEGKQNFFLVLFIVFYYAYLTNNLLLDKIFSEEYISSSAITLYYELSELPDIFSNSLFFDEESKTKIDENDHYSIVINNEINVAVFFTRDQSFFSVACFEILDDKIIETNKSKKLVKLFKNIFQRYNGIKKIEEGIKPEVREFIFKPYFDKIGDIRSFFKKKMKYIVVISISVFFIGLYLNLWQEIVANIKANKTKLLGTIAYGAFMGGMGVCLNYLKEKVRKWIK